MRQRSREKKLDGLSEFFPEGPLESRRETQREAVWKSRVRLDDFRPHLRRGYERSDSSRRRGKSEGVINACSFWLHAYFFRGSRKFLYRRKFPKNAVDSISVQTFDFWRDRANWWVESEENGESFIRPDVAPDERFMNSRRKSTEVGKSYEWGTAR